MSLHSAPSARVLEREADETRRQLSATLDNLADNLTPGRMLDEVIAYSRGGGASFIKGLGNAASTNPLPTLLIGVGAAMFLSGKGRNDSIPRNFSEFFSSSKSHSNDAARSPAQRGTDPARPSTNQRSGVGLADAAHSVTSGVKSAAASVATAATRAAEKIGAEASGAVESITDTVSDVTANVADYADSAMNTTAEGAAHVRDQARRLTHDLRDRAAQLADEQPLIVALAGIALGAVVAALLPRSSIEDELMGETSDTIKDAAGEVVSEQVQNASQEAGKIAEDIKLTVSEHGLTAKSAVEAVREAGARVSQALSESEPSSSVPS